MKQADSLPGSPAPTSGAAPPPDHEAHALHAGPASEQALRTAYGMKDSSVAERKPCPGGGRRGQDSLESGVGCLGHLTHCSQEENSSSGLSSC